MAEDSRAKLEKLKEYHALVKQVTALAEKDAVEEVARILAVQWPTTSGDTARCRWRRR